MTSPADACALLAQFMDEVPVSWDILHFHSPVPDRLR